MSRLNQIEEMLKNEPHDSFLNYALALEYVKLEDLDKAVELIEALLSRDQNYVGAYYQLGKLYEQTGQTAQAATTYKTGIAIARQQKNTKTAGELSEALWMLEDDE